MEYRNQKKYRKSKQREEILRLLKKSTSHPTADWIYSKLKTKFPNLSLGNVYRNLNILLEQGLIREINFGSTYDRYEARTDLHYHFICLKCGSINDLNLSYDDEVDEEVEKEIKGSVQYHHSEFYGVCSKCKKKK